MSINFSVSHSVFFSLSLIPSISPHLCLSIHLFFHRPVSLFQSPISMSLISISLTMNASLCLCLFLSFSCYSVFCVSSSLTSYVYLSIGLPVHLSLYLSVHLLAFSFYPFVCLPVCISVPFSILSICLSACFFVCLYFCLKVFAFGRFVSLTILLCIGGFRTGDLQFTMQ
jgi:hypothetical protein